MPNIKVSVRLELGSQYQIVIKIGGQVLHFQDTESQMVNLGSKYYVAKIAGFQDPTNTDSNVFVEFKQGNTVLNTISIDERKFIKLLSVDVN